MTRDEFTALVRKAIELYMGSFEQYDANPQIKINPATLDIQLVNGSEMFTDIEYSDEAIEEAAGADDPEYEDAMDAQARQNPDFYAVKKLITKDPDGHPTPSAEGIAFIVSTYFK